MLRPLLALVLASATLSACGSAADDEAAGDETNVISTEEVENELGGAMSRGEFFEAGEWETRVEITDLDAPGLSDEARAVTIEEFSENRFRTCLSPEDVKRPDARFFTGEGSDCTYERFSLADGKLDSSMTCRVEGVAQKITLAGDYGPRAFALDMRANTLGDEGFSTTMNVSARRIGDCADVSNTTGGEDQ